LRRGQERNKDPIQDPIQERAPSGPLQQAPIAPSRRAPSNAGGVSQVDTLNQQQGAKIMCAQVGNIGGFLNQAIEKLSDKGADFQTRIAEMSNKAEGISQEDMLNLQFEMGQYNAMIESVANVAKSLTDTLKSLAQKTA
jgi:type III secretion protein F